MNKLHKIILTIITGLAVAIVVIAFTNPTQNPPGGGGAISVGINAPADSIYVKSDGNLGIGTTGPTNALHVYRSGLADASSNSLLLIDGKFNVANINSDDIVGISSRVENSGGGSQTTLNIGFAYGGTGNNLLLQPNGGNVGIGTPSPSITLSVSNTGGSQAIFTGTAGQARVNINAIGTDVDSQLNFLLETGTKFAIGVDDSDSDKFKISGSATLGTTDRFVIDDSGNVGIGTTAPGYKLHNYNSGGNTLVTAESDGTDSVVGYNLLNDARNWDLVVDGADSDKFKIRDWTGGILTRLTIDTSGNVGIGTTGPTEKLEVNGSIIPLGQGARGAGGAADTGNGFRTQGTGGGKNLTLYNDANNDINLQNQNLNDIYIGTRSKKATVVIKDSGNVGIGTTNPGARLDLEGGNIIDVNKISVNTIDPIFEIDGGKYATYMADFSGGVRVETSGLVNVKSREYVIDFENLEKSSDLWLFWQTSNQNLNDLAVILTPAFEGKVWYEKQENKLIIYGEKEGEISYRLSIPRLDYKEHPNLVEGPESVFIKVKDYR